MSSVNIAGSRLLAPYTVVVDFTTRARSPGACWQAASSCIVPMTLSSFIVFLPPALPGVEMMLMWTTVSTSSLTMTFAITGLRMSARTKETSPMSPRGGTASMPMTRATVGSSAAARANRRPRSRETPVTRTTLPALPIRTRAALLAELATLDARLLEQLAVLLLGHTLAPLLDDRTHRETFQQYCGPPDQPAGPAKPIRPRRTGRIGRSDADRTGALPGRRSAGPTSTRAVEALAQVLVHVALEDAERTADTNGGQLAAVDEPVDGHLGDAHHCRDLGDGEELRLGNVPGAGSHRAPHTFCLTRHRLPHR